MLRAQLATHTTRTSDHDWYLQQTACTAADDPAPVSTQAEHSQIASLSTWEKYCRRPIAEKGPAAATEGRLRQQAGSCAPRAAH